MDFPDRFRAALEAQLAGWDDRVETNVAHWTRLEKLVALIVLKGAYLCLKVWVAVQRRRPRGL